MGDFLGHIELESTVDFHVFCESTAGVPTDASSDPTYKIYGSSGPMSNGTGTTTEAETGSVADATNATPINIQSTAHGLVTGQNVTVASVGGNTAANGTFDVTKVDADNFTLDSSVGNGAYTSGGLWHVTGFYSGSHSILAANGYDRSERYRIVYSATVSSAAVQDVDNFEVV